ncbi:alpha/beta hydrolase [Cryobacterium lactosi]|uniref:alpha/beta hydrolase n=1 Tax=Cryobacterium lactosi TaxID=1259202 RepID=UPI003B96E56B
MSGLPETMVISITGDPSTPYEGGVSLADSLGSALLTVEGERHTVALQGISTCVDQAVAAYLIDLTLPLEDARCSL